MLYASPAYEKIWGRPLETLYNNTHTLLDSVHPDDRDRVAEAMARKYENEGYEEEYRIVRPDGTTRWIWARSYLVRDQQGVIGRFAGIAEDISERKWAEKERARLVAIIEYCEDSVISKTTSGVIVGWNRGAERQYGYTAEEMLGRSASVLLFPEQYQEDQHVSKRVLKGEAVPIYETVRKRKDGTSINVSLKVVPLEAREAISSERPTSAKTFRGSKNSRPNLSRRKKWRSSANSRAASPMTSITSSPSFSVIAT